MLCPGLKTSSIEYRNSVTKQTCCFDVRLVEGIAKILRIFWMAVYASRTEALRKLALPGDLMVWTMLPSFLRARW